MVKQIYLILLFSLIPALTFCKTAQIKFRHNDKEVVRHLELNDQTHEIVLDHEHKLLLHANSDLDGVEITCDVFKENHLISKPTMRMEWDAPTVEIHLCCEEQNRTDDIYIEIQTSA